jgi:serine/threonine protein kinase
MGIVYKARDLSLAACRVEVSPAEFARDPDRLQRFKSEPRWRRPNHPHICTVHALGEHLGHPFIVMEYIDGRTLQAAALADVNEAVRFIGQAAQAAGGGVRRALSIRISNPTTSWHGPTAGKC